MGKLNIQDIAKVLVAKNGLELQQANQFATELFAIIQERLQKNDLVKVKGLGTFKVITVEARESVSVRTGGRVMIDEHSKITFTPDAMMKELVNKPFSQFETVVLNDNVEFDDMKEQSAESDAEFDDVKDDLTEEESEQQEQTEETSVISQETPVISQETPVIAQELPVVEEQPVVEGQPIVEEQPIIDEQLIVDDEKPDEPERPEEEPPFIPLIGIPEETPEKTPERTFEKVSEKTPDETSEATAVQTSSENIEEDVETENFDDKEESRSWFKWLWIAFGVITLMGLSAIGGYYYGCQQTPITVYGDTVFVRDTVYVPEIQDSLSTDLVEEPESLQDVAKAEESKIEEPKREEPKEEAAKTEKPKAEPAQEQVDKYAQKDVRVRLGAYRIVGLDHEVKVLQGQTFSSICRAHLGPDMECYIEVYNDLPRNPEVKAGQVIKIPKLQLKKRKKQ